MHRFQVWILSCSEAIWTVRTDRTAGNSGTPFREGAQVTLAKWESEALLLIESGADYGDLRDSARASLEEELQTRLVSWLLDQFVRDNGSFDSSGYVATLQSERNKNLFVMEDGKITRDASGSAVRTELESDAAFEEELSGWREGAADYYAVLVSRWEQSATTAFNDILGSVDGKTRELLSGKQEVLFTHLEQSHRRQADILLLLEQSEYRHFRLRDQYSLRLASEDGSAASQADALITKTRASIQEGLDRLTRS